MPVSALFRLNIILLEGPSLFNGSLEQNDDRDLLLELSQYLVTLILMVFFHKEHNLRRYYTGNVAQHKMARMRQN